MATPHLSTPALTPQDIAQPTKTCTRCHRTLAADHFPTVQRRGRQELRCRCRECSRAAWVEYYRKHHAEIRAARVAHYAANRVQERQRLVDRRKKHPEKGRAYRAAHRAQEKAYSAAYYAAHRAEQRAYREAHKEERKAYFSAWRVRHKAELKPKEVVYAATHRAERKAYRATYKVTHGDVIKAANAAYVATSHGRAMVTAGNARHRARVHTQVSREDKDRITEIYAIAQTAPNLRCFHCNRRIAKGKRHVDHVLPVARNGRHIPGNLVISCARCNQSKGAKLPEQIGLLPMWN